MSVTGYTIEVIGATWTYRLSDYSNFLEKASALAKAGVYIRTGTVSLPGECDAQRADRLARELGAAEAKVRTLERAVVAKRTKQPTARAQTKKQRK